MIKYAQQYRYHGNESHLSPVPLIKSWCLHHPQKGVFPVSSAMRCVGCKLALGCFLARGEGDKSESAGPSFSSTELVTSWILKARPPLSLSFECVSDFPAVSSFFVASSHFGSIHAATRLRERKPCRHDRHCCCAVDLPVYVEQTAPTICMTAIPLPTAVGLRIHTRDQAPRTVV